MKLNNKGNWTLIGLLAAVAAVVVVGYFVFVKGGVGTVEKDSQLLDKGSQKHTVVGKAIDTGKSIDCQERLRQIIHRLSEMLCRVFRPPTSIARSRTRPTYMIRPLAR